MRTRAARFTSRLALVCVILISTVGTGLIAGHLEGIVTTVVTPTWGVNSECVAVPVKPNLPEVLTGEYLHYSTAGRIQPKEKENFSKLKLLGGIFGGVTGLARPLDYPEMNAYDFNALCAVIIAGSVAENKEVENNGSASDLQEEQETTIKSEQYARGIDTTETLEVSYTEEADPPTEPVLKRISTKVKSIETVLRKAVIEPYHNINGQIEGLQISGLEQILVAKDLFLKSGDVICMVNGQLLNSKKAASKVFRKARKLPIMEVELLRNGKAMTFQYYLK